MKWLRRLEVTEEMPDCWYHYQFYYYADSEDSPDKELITTIGVKSMVTSPNDNTKVINSGEQMIRGYAGAAPGP